MNIPVAEFWGLTLRDFNVKWRGYCRRWERDNIFNRELYTLLYNVNRDIQANPAKATELYPFSIDEPIAEEPVKQITESDIEHFNARIESHKRLAEKRNGERK